MNVKKKAFEVLTVTEGELFAHYVALKGLDNAYILDACLGNLKIGEVELIQVDGIFFGIKIHADEIRFTVCSPEVHPAELARLRAKADLAEDAVMDRCRRREITTDQALELCLAERDSYGFKDMTLELHDFILPSMCEKRGLDVYQRVTRLELTGDGVEFTVANTGVPQVWRRAG